MADASDALKVPRTEFEARVRKGGLTVFRYTPNSRGFIFLQVCAAVLFVIAYVVYLSTAFAPLYWAIVSGLVALFALALLALVVYWTTYARRSLVAFDDAALYVAGIRHVDRIPWNDISVENAGFGESRGDGDQGTLRMRIGDRLVALRLFNPFVWIEDFPTFLVELLSQIKRNEDRADSADGEAV